jgi:D-hexose-6-phosphate mutarotase
MDSILLIENELISDPSGTIRKVEVQKLNEICLKAIIELEEQKDFEINYIKKIQSKTKTIKNNVNTDKQIYDRLKY